MPHPGKRYKLEKFLPHHWHIPDLAEGLSKEELRRNKEVTSGAADARLLICDGHILAGYVLHFNSELREYECSLTVTGWGARYPVALMKLLRQIIASAPPNVGHAVLLVDPSKPERTRLMEHLPVYLRETIIFNDTLHHVYLIFNRGFNGSYFLGGNGGPGG